MAKDAKVKGCAIGCVAVGVVGLMGLSTAEHFDRDTYNVKITDTERVMDSSGKGAKYLVFTEDIKSGETRVFENTDTLLDVFWDGVKYSSSDLQSKLRKAEKEGTEVELKTYGWRIPFFSMYENITEMNKYNE